MDEVAKWTRHFRLMAAGKLRKDPKGYYIVNQMPDNQTGGNKAPLDPSTMMDKIPKRYKYKAGALLSYIIHDKRKILAWNSTGQLIYDGVVIPDSNIKDLLVDSQNQYKDTDLAGNVQFNNGLKRLNVPIQLYVVPTTRKRPATSDITNTRKFPKLDI